MSRRRRGGPGVSLFAFQDVITAVCGILVVIVLLLTLELTAEPPAPDDGSAGAAARLRATTAAAIEERDQLALEVESAEATIAAAAGVSPETVREQIAGLRAEIDQLEGELSALDAADEKLTAWANELAVAQFEAAPLKEAAARDADAAAAAEDAADRAKGQLEGLGEGDPRPVFRMPRGSRRAGWLAVASDGGVQIAPLGRAEAPRRIPASGGAFLDELRRAGDPYVFVLVRPDGVANFRTLTDALTDADVDHGFDAAPADQPLLDPRTGAAASPPG